MEEQTNKKWKIIVDLDSAREEAEDLESRVIIADDEYEAEIKAMKIIKEEMYSGPYFNITERKEKDGRKNK